MLRRTRQYGSIRSRASARRHQALWNALEDRVEETSGSNDAEICRYVLPEAQWMFP